MSRLFFVLFLLMGCADAFAQYTYLDSTFGTNGYVVTEVEGGTSTSYQGAFSDVALQPDGKIIAVGTALRPRLTVMRYNSNGTLDNSFATGGIYQASYSGLSSYGKAVGIQADGKILIGCKNKAPVCGINTCIPYSANGFKSLSEPCQGYGFHQKPVAYFWYRDTGYEWEGGEKSIQV